MFYARRSILTTLLCLAFAPANQATSGLPVLLELAPNDGVATQRFGIAIATTAEHIWIGAPNENVAPGALYQFDKLGNQLSKVIPEDSADRDFFGVSILALEEEIFVGALTGIAGAPTPSKGKGSLYAFASNGTQLFKVQANDAQDNDNFGNFVACSGNHLLIGAPNEVVFIGSVEFPNQNGKPSAAYLFDKDGTQLSKLTSANDFNGSWFGFSGAINEHFAVVGAPQPQGNLRPGLLGAVYVFDHEGNELFPLAGSGVTDNDLFGQDIAIFENLTFVGAPSHVAVVKSGAVFVFNNEGIQVAKLVPPDGAIDDGFGFSIAVSAKYIVVGSPVHQNVGAVYVYNTVDFSYASKLMKASTTSGDRFGTKVFLDENGLLLVSDPSGTNFKTGTTSGAVFAFDLSGLEMGKGSGNILSDLELAAVVSASALFVLILAGVLFVRKQKKKSLGASVLSSSHSGHDTGSKIVFDCFLTHDWGANNVNHERVAAINKRLKKEGLRTWFDEERLTGNIVQQVTRGIEQSRKVVVFVTRNYMEKLQVEQGIDYCSVEFTTAAKVHGPQNMIAVVLEPEMRDQRTWRGPLQGYLGEAIFLDFSTPAKIEENMPALIRMLSE